MFVQRSRLESVCAFTASHLSSLVTQFSVVTVNGGLASPCILPGVIVMMGVCMLYLGTKRGSYFQQRASKLGRRGSRVIDSPFRVRNLSSIRDAGPPYSRPCPIGKLAARRQ